MRHGERGACALWPQLSSVAHLCLPAHCCHVALEGGLHCPSLRRRYVSFFFWWYHVVLTYGCCFSQQKRLEFYRWQLKIYVFICFRVTLIFFWFSLGNGTVFSLALINGTFYDNGNVLPCCLIGLTRLLSLESMANVAEELKLKFNVI